jgi:adiponectin receptor
MLEIHNETGLSWRLLPPINSAKPLHEKANSHKPAANIWSHLLGAFYIIFGLHRFLALSPSSYGADTLAVATFFICCTTCFTLSGAYHTFADHSPSVLNLCNRIDHLGIVLIVWGAGVSANHFAFPTGGAAAAVPKLWYFAALTAASAACAWFTLQPMFKHPTSRAIRSAAYSLLGLNMVLPLIHALSVFGLEALDENVDVASFFHMGALVFIGGVAYATRVPERWCPRTFDLLGQSHNWLHVFVLAGALVRLDGLLLVHERRLDTS